MEKGFANLGIGIVLGLLIAGVGSGAYHLAGIPRFCASCHSMGYVAARWGESRHKQFACTECHLPAGGLVEKMVYKVRAGVSDLYQETLRDYGAAATLSKKGRSVANGNCVRCHFATIERTALAAGGRDCLRCHQGLVHGRGVGEGVMRYEE